MRNFILQILGGFLALLVLYAAWKDRLELAVLLCIFIYAININEIVTNIGTIVIPEKEEGGEE